MHKCSIYWNHQTLVVDIYKGIKPEWLIKTRINIKYEGTQWNGYLKLSIYKLSQHVLNIMIF